MSDRDIFICHAGEDKEEIVRPMVESFSQAGITCWYDEAEIKWGDSITQKINEGLSISRYVVVVFSEAFIAKNWPQRELNAVLNMEASSGEVKVLPLLVGSERQKAEGKRQNKRQKARAKRQQWFLGLGGIFLLLLRQMGP